MGATTLDRRSGARHFELFDGLRALAALSVVLIHLSSATGMTTGTYWRFASRLDVGVAIFFAISGFLLYRPFAARHIAGAGTGAVGRYLRRRVLRIVPAYWTALTVLAIYPGLVGVFSREGPAYYGFLQIYGVGNLYGGIFPAWSLSIELTFYLFLPVYAWGIARAGRGRPSLGLELAGLAALTSSAIVFHYLLYSGRWVAPTVELSLLGRFDWFVPGMLLAIVSVRLEAGAASRLVRIVERAPLVPWALAAGTFALLALVVPVSGYTTGLGAVAETLTFACVGFFLLLPAVFGEREGGLPRRLLGWRPMAWLGLISYGIYLYHYPLAYFFAGHLSRTGTFAATLVCTIGAAAVSWYLLERPILTWNRRHERAPERVAPEPAEAPVIGIAGVAARS